jgi:hypothetical protein
MQTQNDNNYLPIPLYHGTSTLFLDSIIKNGLGGVNPVKELNLIELSKEVFNLCETHLKGTDFPGFGLASFKAMTEQTNPGKLNWQHGDTYLAAALKKAAGYAINKQYGSELLTYTIFFLKELLRLKIDYVTDDLAKKYKKVFKLIHINPAPVLIQVNNVLKSALLDEKGENPQSHFNDINEDLNMEIKFQEMGFQAYNFRLISPIPLTNLKLYLIHVNNYNQFKHEFTQYEIKIV